MLKGKKHLGSAPWTREGVRGGKSSGDLSSARRKKARSRGYPTKRGKSSCANQHKIEEGDYREAGKHNASLCL